MAFLTEPEPAYGAALPVLPGIRRVVAANASVMTYHGTNTYLIDGPDGTIVLDPGPKDMPAHLDAIIEHAGRIALILLSHHHSDHVGAVPALRERVGAPLAAWHDGKLAPDIALHDMSEVAGWQALHTPGHAPDHLCFARTLPDGTRVLFSADHVMSWSSSIVNPPDGKMAAYLASLKRLLARDDDVFLPGHGPPLPEPRVLTADLLSHRERREVGIRDAMRGRRDVTTKALTEALYSQTHPMLKLAAERNVLAHLIKLEGEGAVVRDGEAWSDAG